MEKEVLALPCINKSVIYMSGIHVRTEPQNWSRHREISFTFMHIVRTGNISFSFFHFLVGHHP